MMAKQLMKKGKLEVAAYIKAECNKPPGHAQLNTLLDYLLDPNKPLDDTDRLDWCRSLIAGGTSFEEYAKIGKFRIDTVHKRKGSCKSQKGPKRH